MDSINKYQTYIIFFSGSLQSPYHLSNMLHFYWSKQWVTLWCYILMSLQITWIPRTSLNVTRCCGHICCQEVYSGLHHCTLSNSLRIRVSCLCCMADLNILHDLCSYIHCNVYIFPKELSMFPSLEKVELFHLWNPYLHPFWSVCPPHGQRPAPMGSWRVTFINHSLHSPPVKRAYLSLYRASIYISDKPFRLHPITPKNLITAPKSWIVRKSIIFPLSYSRFIDSVKHSGLQTWGFGQCEPHTSLK